MENIKTFIINDEHDQNLWNQELLTHSLIDSLTHLFTHSLTLLIDIFPLLLVLLLILLLAIGMIKQMH